MRRNVTLVCLLAAAALGGCSEGILDPKGPIAVAERQILLNSLGIMLAIVIPTILATLTVAFWFRSSNTRAQYLPNFNYSGRLEILVWSIPAMTVLLVGGVAWLGAHDLDPRRPISSTVKPVSVRTTISFQLTSAGVMNSFFVPQLGGQIYTMSGMTTQLQLQADHSGSYPGFSSQFSGDGFADMRFTVDAMAPGQFEQWVSATRNDGPVLDPQTYSDLAKPSEAVAPFTYRKVAPNLFNGVILNSGMQSDDPLCLTVPELQRVKR
jgi:cytochrome o ubiquinol oxidase subunit 2